MVHKQRSDGYVNYFMCKELARLEGKGDKWSDRVIRWLLELLTFSQSSECLIDPTLPEIRV